MSVLVYLEAGHLEIGNLIDESAVLCAQGDMFSHRHVESTPVNQGTSGLFVTHRSPRGSKNMAPPPASTNGDTILTPGILKEGSFTIAAPVAT
jgi:hypothetical protein